MTALKFELDIDAEIRKLALPPANSANSANQDEHIQDVISESGRYTGLVSSSANTDPEDIELKFEIEERAAIMEIDGGLPRKEAERMAFERVLGALGDNELETVKDLSLSQVKLLIEAKFIFDGTIIS
jgi:hypothetical protein